MQLSAEFTSQSLRLFNDAREKQDNASQALKGLRLGTFFRLSRGAAASQTEAFRLLRQSGGLLHGAEIKLGMAAALFAQVESNLDNDV